MSTTEDLFNQNPTSVNDGYTAWFTPDSKPKTTMPKYTNLKYVHLEMIRFSVTTETASAKARYLEQSVTGQLAPGTQVFEMTGDYFGTYGGDSYFDPTTFEWIKANYSAYLTISGTGYHGVDEMCDNNNMQATAAYIVQYAKNKGFVGVETNIESVGQIKAVNIDKYKQFLTYLGDGAHANGLKFRFTTGTEYYNDAQTGYIKSPALPWRNSFIPSLPIDEVLLMCYDEQFTHPQNANSSFQFIELNINSLLEDGVPLNKIVIGLPNYGHFAIGNNFQYLIDGAPTLAHFKPQIDAITQRDPLSGELYSHSATGMNGETGTLYFSDHEAIKQKMQVAQNLNVNKFGIWVAMPGFDWVEPVDWTDLETITPPNPEPTEPITTGPETGTKNGNIYTYSGVELNNLTIGYSNVKLSQLKINGGDVTYNYELNSVANSIVINQTFNLNTIEIVNIGETEVYIEGYGPPNGDLLINTTVQPTEPIEPAPTEPVPTEPAPTEPVPTEPEPIVEPEPSQPEPTPPPAPAPEPTEPNAAEKKNDILLSDFVSAAIGAALTYFAMK